MWVFVILGALAAALGLVLAVPMLFENLFCRWYGSSDGATREKYRAVSVREPPKDTMRRALRSRLRVIWLLLSAGFCGGLVLAITGGGGETVKTLERPAFGEGDAQVELVAECGGVTETVHLDIGEQKPDQDEVERFFASASEAALLQVLGDNADFEHVETNLNLITRMDQGIEIEWQVSDPEVISIFGVPGENIPMEGAAVELVMNMKYGDFSRSFRIPVTVRPRETAGEGAEALSEYISDSIAQAPGTAQIALPKEYKDSTLVLRRKSSASGQNLALLVLIAALLIWLSAGRSLDDAYAERNRGLEADYPDIVSRLSILLSAGLSVPAAWKRLSADYERELAQKKPMRCGYEELRLTALELSNAGYSEQVFYDFGRRCGNYRYMKLADILEQSMKRGTVQLTAFMEQEAAQAFELRRMQAAKKGEEAGTKLLLPMMLMFGLVIAMVVVPAWSGMRL